MKRSLTLYTASACIAASTLAASLFLPPLAPNPKSTEAPAATSTVSSSDNSNELYLYQATIVTPETPPPSPEDDGFIFQNKNVRIISLGKMINWSGLDYAPSVDAKGTTLYFVSNRKGSALNKSGDPSHDFWMSTKGNRNDTIFTPPVLADTVFAPDRLNSANNEGVGSISADGQKMFFTGCNRANGIGDCDIYVVEIEGDHFGKAQNLGRNINSVAWDSQPSYAADGSRLYFASNREGGVGGIDIWYSDHDVDTDEWSPAKNAGPTINTPEKDWAPFISASGFLFFSSDGHKPNLGGTDFYMAKPDAKGNWVSVKNLGSPINTSQDDQFITIPASNDIMYFSSSRTDIPGYQGNLDVFMAFIPSFSPAVIVKGRVLDECSEEDIPATIVMRNPANKKVYYDTLNAGSKKEFELLINKTDFGSPKDSINSFELEVTATNPKYGSKTTKIRVDKPKDVESQEEVKNIVLDKNIIKLGQRPVLRAEMDFADYVKRNSADPKIASFKGLVMEEVVTISLYPLLRYVFFEEGSSTIPARYILFKNNSDVQAFSDEKIPGGTFEKYYNVMNIYGYRMLKNPNAKLVVTGCNDQGSDKEKRPGLSKERAENVYAYLKNVWNIPESRLELKFRDLPEVKSNVKDSLGIVENRRVELFCDDWEVSKPILDSDPTRFPSPEKMSFVMTNGIEDNLVASRYIEVMRGGKMWKKLSDVGTTTPSKEWNWRNDEKDDRKAFPADEEPYQARLVVVSQTGRECASDWIKIPVKQVSTKEKATSKDNNKTLEVYNLILFPFNSYEAGPLNDRIMKEYVYPRVFFSSEVEIEGHTDVVGLYDHNKKLSQNRAKTVDTGIRSTSKGKFKSLKSDGVGEDTPLYDNTLPEGRFYNRTVQIKIQTPLEDTKTNERPTGN